MNKKPLALATALLIPVLAVSPTALADDQSDLAKKVELLEQQLQSLKQQLTEQVETQKHIEERVATKEKASKSGTEFSFGGFIKVDAMATRYSDKRRASNVGDDFLVPSQVGVGAGGVDETLYDMHAKHSRIWFKSVTNTDVGAINSYIEMDFNSAADERLTNQATEGLRHAFFSWKYSENSSVLAGQTWSTFFNVAALPEAVDFIGPTSGTLFDRQAQLRWTTSAANGTFMLAAENPSSGFNDGGSGVDSSNFDDSGMPDLVVRYDGKAGALSYSLAAISRDLAYNSGAFEDSATGLAISLSGKYQFDNGNDIKFMYSKGNLGRYIALNAFRDGVVLADGSIDKIDVSGGFIAYKHNWTDKLRSTFSYATATADNPSSAVADLTKSVSNININLMYSPTKKLTFGGEYIAADRETESGADGDMTRIQLMGKYAF